MKGYSRIIQYVRRYKGLVFLNIFFNMFYVVFGLFSIAMILPFLRLLFRNDVVYTLPTKPVFIGWLQVSDFVKDAFNYYFTEAIIHQGKPAVLLFICLFIVVLFFLKNVFNYLALWALSPIRYGVVRDVRESLFQKILILPLSFFSKEKKGDLLARMSADVQQIENSIISTLEVTFREPVTILFHFAFLVYISYSLTLFVVAMVVVMILVVGTIGRNLKRTTHAGQEKLGQLLSIVEESLGGIKIIKAFNAERYQERRFEQHNESFFQLMTKMLRRRSLASPLTEFLSITIVALILFYGGNLVLKGHLQGDTFILFILIFALMIPPAKNFSSAFYNIQQGLASSERIDAIMNADNEIFEQPNALAIESFEHQIEYKGVGFAYHNYDNKPVLKNIDVSIEKGKTLALVGQSGSGKSTFVDLLPRFYDVVQGQILVDGVDIRQYRLKDLRKLMGMVSQEAILFNDTVHNNIAFGLENVTRDDVVRAAKVANAHQFIEKLGMGYDTPIGDRGNKLSGGEKQRLTIARAVLNDPPILILDEATSSLDTESEKLVQDALYNLMQNRTTIVIAHRLSTIQNADEILVMQYGEITERGNHQALMAKGANYKRLVDMQMV